MELAKSKKTFLYFFLFFILLLFYVWQQLQVVGLGYKIESREKEIRNLDEENRRLSIRIGELASLEHIEKVAREKLQMKPANAAGTVILPEPR